MLLPAMRWLVAVFLALTVATAFAADQDGPWLTGRFLVATEELGGPPFVHTVIYLILHDAGGAMGLIVNRPVGEVPLARLLDSLGLDATGVSGNLRVHYGGPVEPARAFVLHTSDYTGPNTRAIRDGISLSADHEIFDVIGHGKGPARSLFTFGYAGWAPGQLEDEIRRGSWFTVDADRALLFSEDDDRKWERATARRKIQL
jgi:putative transcriptional regulator